MEEAKGIKIWVICLGGLGISLHTYLYLKVYLLVTFLIGFIKCQNDPIFGFSF